MSRVIVYGLLILVLGGMAAVWGGGAWLLESPDGVRWLLRRVSTRTAVRIDTRTVTGGIGQTLRLEGVTVRWPLGKVDIDEVRLRCRPLLLPFGHLAVQDLFLRGVRIQDNEPDTGRPPDLTWPRLSAPGWLDAWIDRLRVEGLTYRRLENPPLAITGISAALDWRHAALSARNLTISLPTGTVTGSAAAGFDRPSLSANLSFTPPQPVAGATRFDLRARLLPGRSPEQLSGTVSFAALSGRRASLELIGDLGVARDSLTLKGLKLTRPGIRGTVRGEGAVHLTATKPRINLSLRLAGLDLAAETGMAAPLSGDLSMAGDMDRYAGRFDLTTAGKGWKAMRLTGVLSGNSGGMTLAGLDAALLSGTVTGGLRLGWTDGVTIGGALRGVRLDPARITPEWSGELNLDLRGNARWPGKGPLEGDVTARFRESRLRGLPLSGELAARSAGGSLAIDRLLLVGKGFDLKAGGDLRQRLNVAATITDLSGLVPRTGGKLDLHGWVRYAAGRVSGAATGSGRDLAGEGMRAAAVELAARVDAAPGSTVDITAGVKGLTYRHLHADTAALRVRGTMARHTLETALVSAGAEIRGVASGGYRGGGWAGEITTLRGRDRVGPWRLEAPASLTVSPETLILSPLRLAGTGAERLELSSRLYFSPLRGGLHAAWNGLDLNRADQWLADIRLSGRSTGSLRLESPAGDRVNLTARLAATGAVSAADRTVTIRQASLELEAGGKGIRSSVELATAEGIRAQGRFTSPAPARLGIPDEGTLDAAWEGFDLALLRRLLPPEIGLDGVLSGTVSGRLLTGARLDLAGTAVLSSGAARWHGEGRQITARVRKGDLSWRWRGEVLSGTASLALADYGEVAASLALPLPAELATSLNEEGPVRGSLKGRLHEKGVLTALFPGLIRESRGEAAVDLQVDGAWREPRVTGRLELSKAGAYLPAAGVTLKEVQLAADLERDRITVNRFTVTSDTGSVGGSAAVRLDGYRVTSYRGEIRGERFQAVRLPELQVLASPDITFEGTPDRLTLRGTVRIPELTATGSDRTTAVVPSRDVVVEGGEGAAPRSSPLALDGTVRVELGDRVFVKVQGLDGKLEGGVELTLRGAESVKGTGEIRVTKGRYSAYGVSLDIRRGRALFAGGPVERPTLDILALREIGAVKAGVTVRGTPEAPVVKLYAEPAMPDVEILSYIVLGRRINDNEEKSGLLMNAASLLASAGESVYLQEQIKQRLGIDTFEVTTAKKKTSAYTKIEPSLLSPSQKTSTSSIAESMLQVGKYLTPQLYISYGWSLFNDSHVFRVRYNLTKQWEIETRTGTDATGGDIFYRIEFE